MPRALGLPPLAGVNAAQQVASSLPLPSDPRSWVRRGAQAIADAVALQSCAASGLKGPFATLRRSASPAASSMLCLLQTQQ